MGKGIGVQFVFEDALSPTSVMVGKGLEKACKRLFFGKKVFKDFSDQFQAMSTLFLRKVFKQFLKVFKDYELVNVPSLSVLCTLNINVFIVLIRDP